MMTQPQQTPGTPAVASGHGMQISQAVNVGTVTMDYSQLPTLRTYFLPEHEVETLVTMPDKEQLSLTVLGISFGAAVSFFTVIKSSPPADPFYGALFTLAAVFSAVAAVISLVLWLINRRARVAAFQKIKDRPKVTLQYTPAPLARTTRATPQPDRLARGARTPPVCRSRWPRWGRAG